MGARTGISRTLSALGTRFGDGVQSAVAWVAAGNEKLAVVSLCLTSVVLTAGSLVVGPATFPAALQVVPILVGGLVLRRRPMRLLLVTAALALTVLTADQGWREVRPGALVAMAFTGLIAYEFSRSRDRLGLSAPRSETMLIELGDRLRMQGVLPALPQGWHAEGVLAPAGGGAFGGDFAVSVLTHEGGRLELALVDVSGKGVDAGTRALLLSGAMGGLLGALPSEDFLPAADRYLQRQHWEEGFATAVHVSIDLETGAYTLVSAGHPPAAQFDAGSGRWHVSRARGLLLGIVPGAVRETEQGLLRSGDALMLYTDGLVELPGRDLAVGLDKLLGEAERLVPRGFAGGVDRLVDAVAPQPNDDRAIVLLWRTS